MLLRLPSRTILWLAFFALLICQSIYLAFSLVDHDIVWGQEIASRMLNHGSYQQDFFENNPPLLFYCHAISNKVSQLFSLNSVYCWYGFISLLSIISFAISQALLKRVYFDDKNAYNTSVVFLLLTLFIVPIINFGQKSHFLVLLTLPYFLSFLLKIYKTPSINKAWQIGIGLMAAIGFSLKPPYYFFAPILAEGWWMLRSKKLTSLVRLDVVAGLSFMLVYVATIFAFFPDYIKTVFPIALKSYAPLETITWLGLLLSSSSILFLLTLASVMGFFYFANVRSTNKTALDDVIICFLMISFGFLLCFVLQKKGWPYQEIPVLSFLMMTIGFFFLRVTRVICQTTGEKFFVGYVFLTILLVVLTPLLASRIKSRLQCTFNQNCHLMQMMKDIKKVSPKGSAFVFSEVILPSYLSYYGNLTWGSRFGSLWMMPYHLNGDKKVKNDFTDSILKMLLEDFKRYKPCVVLVSHRKDRSFFDVGENYLRLMQQLPAFQKIWAGYKYEKTFTDIPEFNFSLYASDAKRCRA